MQITNLVPTGAIDTNDFVPITRTINGQALSDNITLSKTDIGLSGVTNDAQLKIASNLSDLNNVATARTNLGLGDSATKNVGTTAGSIMAGDDSRVVNAVPNTRTVNSKALSSDITLDKTDIGLSSVTNDAQLKRSANDFSTFTEKGTPVSADIALLEDSASSGAKKKFQLGNIAPMIGDSPTANAVTVTTPLPPQTLNDDDSFSVNVGQSVENGRVQAKLYKLVADGSGTTDIDIDFDSADESLYVQEDASKTDFSGGSITLHNSANSALLLLHVDHVLEEPTFSVGASTKALLHCNGTNGSTTITDETSKTVTVNGGAQISTAQSRFGGASLYLASAGDYLTLADSNDWNFSNGDFEIAFSIRPSSTNTRQQIIGQHNWGVTASLIVEYNPTKITTYLHNVAISPTAFDATYSFTLDTWYDVIIGRSGNNLYCYIRADGESQYTLIAVQTYSDTLADVALPLSIGATHNGSNSQFYGYIDEIHVKKGDSSAMDFVDDGINSLALTKSLIGTTKEATLLASGGGVKMANASAFVKTATGNTFNLTGEFTQEMWFKTPASLSGDNRLCMLNNDHLQVLSPIAGQLHYAPQGTSLGNLASLSPSTVYHFAASRNSSNQLEVYLNGTRIYNSTLAGTVGGNSLYFGLGLVNYAGCNGYILDEVYITNVAKYTGATITVPTSPFSAYDYPTDQGYFVYIGSTLELDLENVTEIDSLTITSTSPTNTLIKGLVSFDQGLTWKKWNGSAFVTVATAASTSEANIKSALSAIDWTANANTTAELATAHTNLDVASYDSWKIALYLRTSDSAVSPSISQVSIAYTMGTVRYDLVTGFRAANADAIVTYNDDTITVQNKINDGQNHSYLMNLIYY